MSAGSDESILWRQAMRLHLRNRLGRLKYRHDGGLVRDKDQAFANYFAFLFKEMRRPPIAMELVSRRRLDRYRDGPATWELRLRPDRDLAFEPGDMIRLPWQNHAETVQQITELLPACNGRRFRVWGDGITFLPPPKLRVDASTLLQSVIDLEVASNAIICAATTLPEYDATARPRIRLASLLRSNPHLANWTKLIRLQPRIRPRIYTIARMPEDDAEGCLSVIASEREVAYAGEVETGIGRCVGHLGQLEPGAVLHGYRMRHPHRLPCAYGYSGPGLAVVTGSGIAGVLAFLRNRRAPARLWLVWGVRCCAEGGYYLEELQQYAKLGIISRLDIVESRPTNGRPPQRVTQFLQVRHNEVAQWLHHIEAWAYVSGQEAMGSEVAQVLDSASGEGIDSTVGNQAGLASRLDLAHSMRCIVSTS